MLNRLETKKEKVMKANQVACGDSIQLIQNIDSDSVHLILSDIPYGIGAEDWDVLHKNTNAAYLGQAQHKRMLVLFSRNAANL